MNEESAEHGSDLLDTEAVAAVLNVKPGTVTRYLSQSKAGRMVPPLPDPVRVFGQSPVWRRSDIEAWRASRPGRTGRPRGSGRAPAG